VGRWVALTNGFWAAPAAKFEAPGQCSQRLFHRSEVEMHNAAGE
jgi:hypothetical protein